MSRRADKPPRKKHQTHELLNQSEETEDDLRHRSQSDRSRHSQDDKMRRTALLRTEVAADLDTLPIGQVKQVHSLYCLVSHASGERLCVVRKTLTKLSETAIVVGDEVRFRDGTPGSEPVIEQIMPRRTVLTRCDSFLNDRQHPIVANAKQMLIVASLVRPAIKWGLIDRMIVAAKSGGLIPIVCVNKVDLSSDVRFADEVLGHYRTMGVGSCKTSAIEKVGLVELRELLKDQTTVLAGHSGVGKSSLITAIQPALDIRTSEVSRVTEKGRHTTTAARRYELDFGGCVIDTPGVKHFGLWGVTRANLLEYFPDVAAEAAPEWRKESYQRIAESLPN